MHAASLFLLLYVSWAIPCLVRAEESESTLLFEEDLRIGPEGDAYHNTWNGSWVFLSANNAGHIFIVDPSNNRILQYGPDGEIINEIGGEGSDPGQFKGLRTFSILEDQTGIAYENQQGQDLITRFDNTMKFMERITPEPKPMAAMAMHFSPNGKQISSLFYTPPNENGNNKVIFGLLSSNRKLLNEVSSLIAIPFQDDRAVKPDWWLEFLAPWVQFILDGQGIISFGSDSSAYMAVNNAYKITRLSPGDEKPFYISKSHKPDNYSEEEVRAIGQKLALEVRSIFPPKLVRALNGDVGYRAFKNITLKKPKPMIYDMIPTGDGGLLVICEYNWATGTGAGDLFDKSGNLRGRVSLPPFDMNLLSSFFGRGAKLLIKGERAFVLHSPSPDLTYLVRYKVRKN